MSKIRKTLSSKMRNDGKLQIMLQVIITRTCRPRIKSGVYVNPSLFDQKKGEIIVPKRGKLNLPLWEEAINVQRELNDECNVIERIVNAAYGHLENPTSEWIDKVRSYYKLGLLLPHKGYNDVINWESIEKAFEEANATEEAVKASIVSTPTAFSSLTDIHQIFDYYVDHHKRTNTQEPMSKTRRGQYQTLSRLIQRFELYVQATRDPKYSFDYNTIDHFDLDALRDYLRNEATLAKADPEIFSEIEKKAPLSLSLKQKRPLSDRGSNYLAKLMKNLKCVFSWMNENDITANLPFKKFETGEQVYGRPIYLTKEERNIIADADFSDQPLTLQEQRDIFVFQCQVGCRVSDLKELRPENVHDGILEYAPKKTSHNSNPINPRVPLTPQALEIIEKYKDNPFRQGRLLPFISDQKYNEYIKDIFRVAGITRLVYWRNPRTDRYELKPINEVASSHMARKTFVGTIYKEVKDPSLISRMSGHSENSKSFSRYRDIDDEDLKEVIGKIG